MIGSVDVYTFRAAVQAYPEDAWREFEILSCATVGQLGACVLAAFESLAYHLWYIMWNDVRYEYIFPESADFCDEEESEPVSPDFVTLRDMFLLPGDTLVMKYDSGANWDFDIELLDIRHAEMTDQYVPFPRLTSGAGGGMIENVSPQEVARIMAHKRAGKELQEEPRLTDIADEIDGEWTNAFNMALLADRFRASAKLIELGYQDLHPEDLLEIADGEM